MTLPMSSTKACVCSGNCGTTERWIASSRKITCTCSAVSPAWATRARSRSQKGSSGFLITPEVAAALQPFTNTMRGLRAGLGSSRRTNIPHSCASVEAPRPIKPISPPASSGLPAASRGTICPACSSAPARCVAGGSFTPPG